MERFGGLTLAIGLGVYLVGVGVSQSLMSLGSALLCFFAISVLGRFRSLPRPERRLVGFVLGLIVWSFFTLLNRFLNHEPMEWKVLETLPLFLVILIAVLATPRELSFLRSPRVSSALVGLWGLAFGVSALYAIYQGLIEGRMATAWLRNPIYLAYNLFFPFVGIVTVLRTLTKMSQRGALISVFLLLFAILATNSRMVLGLSVLFISGLLGPWFMKRGARLWILAAVIVFAGVAFHEYLTKPYVRERIAALGDTTHPSTQGRLKVWHYNLGLIRDHPLTGVGYKQNALYTRDLEPFWKLLWGDDVAIYAHNIYLQAVAESGIIGLLLLIAMFSAWLKVFPTSWPLVLALGLGGLTENVLTNSKQLHSLLCTLLVFGLWTRLGSRRGGLEPEAVL